MPSSIPSPGESLLERFPILSQEWHPTKNGSLKPSSVKPNSFKKVWWLGKCGHEWDAPPTSRTTKNSGCPICTGKRVAEGINDLATLKPDYASEWHPTKNGSLKPNQVSIGSGKRVWWLGKCGHEWDVAIGDRVSYSTGCPICSNKKILVGFNDLATTNPDLAKEADGWDPTTVTVKSGMVHSWKCNSGHQWNAKVATRSNGHGCPICINQQVLVGYNDLATTNPDLAKEADGWDPTTVTVKSGMVHSWKCNSGHQWKTNVATRSNGHGCPICSNKKILVGYNDLATTNPDLAKEADGWDPTTVTKGANLKRRWKCEYGHQWQAKVANRNKGDNCPICSNQQVLVGYNDLATTKPELAGEAYGWDPTTVVEGSGKKAKWICELGHIWTSVISNRSKLDSGCPTCSQFGFDPNQPGFLYLIDHFELEMFQIGITNFPTDRLSQHERRGWEVIELRGPMDGHLTQQLETSCLHALEKRGAILGHKAGVNKFDGYSEAWTKASLNVTSIKQLLDWVYEDE